MFGSRDDDGLAPLKKAKSSDSTSSTKSRSGFGWFKKLSSRIENIEPHRRGSVGSNSDSAADEREERMNRRLGLTKIDGGSTLAEDALEYPPISDSASEHVVVRNSAPKDASLEDLKKHRINTKVVSFALSTYEDNPPQRIPPVHPSRGNVEFTKNGELVIKKRPKHHTSTEPVYLGRNHFENVDIAMRNANQNAKRLHTTLDSDSRTRSDSFNAYRVKTNDPEDEEDQGIKQMDVDGTKNLKRSLTNSSHPFDNSKSPPSSPVGTTEAALGGTKLENYVNANGKVLPSPEDIYTRCCHLREIMPIKNMLKQLQGQLPPIPRLKIANTKPTMVEILALSDFLTVVPVACMAVEDQIITAQMVRYIFAGLARSKDLVRLTLVNTKLDIDGWRYLCVFLATCQKSLLALNLACTNPTGSPSRIPPFNRKNMDWKLLTDSLKELDTLEELDLGGTGIKTSDLQYLLANGVANIRMISLANNDLKHEDVKLVADWAQSTGSQLMGINLSGNDLSKSEDWNLIHSFLTNPRMLQFVLRNAKLSGYHAASISSAFSPEQALKSNLRQLDLSLNPGLFPSLVDSLVEILPRFPYLSRLQLDSCGLDSESIITLCEALSHCHRLVYVSFVGNGKISETAATALCVAVHLSRSICTVEADVAEWSVPLRQQLVKYCLMNLEANTGSSQTVSTESDENSDIASFHDDLRMVADEVSSMNESGDRRSKAGTAQILESIESLEKRIRSRMQTLLSKRKGGSLNVSDREATVKLFFYSNNLDRLRRDLTDPNKDPEPVAEEVVENVGEEDIPPLLVRANSQEQIMTLKNMEREEGESHKIYTEHYNTQDMEKLKVGDLEKIMN
ncbi:Mhp1 protein [Starmerella bacillaris]|uniref:Mhp1 protein n=1 Tax=Starmerella bacillaris TaxID=1247836 RepID=A0AAV5RL11_STABA|nr:Mhp1 protein [Starmerella bacillaris]